MNRSFQFLCIVFLLISPTIIPAQEWVARYNGPGNGDDCANAIVVDNTGNVYVTGWSLYNWSERYHDYATIKYDPSGIEQWVVTYDFGDYDWASSLVIDGSSNVYVTGTSRSLSNDNDYATVKYDSLGVEQWVARYNGPGSGDDRAYSIALDMVDNVYVAGGSFGLGSSVDYATLKYDSMGVEQWVVRYNGPGNASDKATAIAVDSEGSIYVTGESWGSNTNCDYATIKYDSLGVEQWVARYDGIENFEDRARAVTLDNEGNVYVTGYSYGGASYYDYATVKYDTSGTQQWVARYDGPAGSADSAKGVAVDDNGNVYVTGWTCHYVSWPFFHFDYATVKYDSLGEEQWVAQYGGPGGWWDGATAITLDSAGNIYVTGWSTGVDVEYDYATIKYSPTGIEESKATVKKGNEITTTIFHGPLQLPKGKRCKVFDITGRVVRLDMMQPGIYFVQVDGEMSRKVIKIR